MSDVPRLLEMTAITKRFPGVVALSEVSLTLRKGEVLALVGENGAGKSTLMKVLGGVHQPDEGEIRIDGKAVVLDGVTAAKRHGISLIHQELMLAPNLDVAGNIFLGAEHRRGLGILDRASMNRKAAEMMKRVGLDLPPTTPLRNLTTGQMQMVEIAKSLAMDARIIIMDEPTSSLTPVEAEKLFAIIADLKASGIAIVYISHRFEEILRITDRITIMRDGRYVGDRITKDTDHDQLVSMMIGRDFTTRFPVRVGKPGEVLLGQSTPISAANYVVGVPAALPTGTFARVTGGVTAETFLKKMSIAKASPEALQRMSPAVLALADHEGFPAHAAAVRARLAEHTATTHEETFHA